MHVACSVKQMHGQMMGSLVTEEGGSLHTCGAKSFPKSKQLIVTKAALQALLLML